MSNADIHAFYRKVDVVAAWECVNKVPYAECITYWFGDYGMHSPKYEHRDEIEGAYERILSEGHPLLNESGGYPPVYRQTDDFARSRGEMDAYKQSDGLNAACAEAVDGSVGSSGCISLQESARSVLSQYGAGRVAWVLANVMRERKYDGCLSYDNRQWAMAFPIPIEYRPSFTLKTASDVLDDFVKETLEIFADDIFNRKPSVLKQIREAREAPKTPRRENSQEQKKRRDNIER